MAMTLLGNGLHVAARHEESLSVKEAELSTLRRLGDSESNILIVQSNLASTYRALGREGQANRMQRDVYFGRLKLNGDQSIFTLRAANNYANSLGRERKIEEVKLLMRKMLPVARRLLEDDDRLTLTMRATYAKALYEDDGATLDDLREAVDTYEDTERTARRVFGGAHPFTGELAEFLREARAVLRARETPSPPGQA